METLASDLSTVTAISWCLRGVRHMRCTISAVFPSCLTFRILTTRENIKLSCLFTFVIEVYFVLFTCSFPSCVTF